MASPRSYLRTLHNWVTFWGVNPLTTLKTLRGLPFYFRDLLLLRRQRARSARPFDFGPAFICVHEKFAAGGTARGHYFHQDLLVARRIHQRAPQRHVDVGSRVDGFVAHVASFRPIEVLDIRPLKSSVPNLHFLQGDLMQPLAPQLVACTDSLSCLHALEHFGLGRYGDPVDHDGYLLGLANLARMVRPGGRLYLSVPIGPQRIEFNAHRVFAVATLLELVAPQFEVDGFSIVDDDGDLHENVALDAARVASNFGCRYGCGILELTRRAP
jgi:SAM-dependent methyltransferase